MRSIDANKPTVLAKQHLLKLIYNLEICLK